MIKMCNCKQFTVGGDGRMDGCLEIMQWIGIQFAADHSHNNWHLVSGVVTWYSAIKGYLGMVCAHFPAVVAGETASGEQVTQ